MGLDMYLKASRYVGGWEFSKEPERAMFAAILRDCEMPQSHVALGSPSVEVTVTVGYWRKANQIHKWFVDNVQGGEDECVQHYVSRKQLERLRALCAEAIAKRSSTDLPPKDGFFFGSTDVDEFYWSHLEHTVAVIDKCLLLDAKTWEFYYRSSW